MLIKSIKGAHVFARLLIVVACSGLCLSSCDHNEPLPIGLLAPLTEFSVELGTQGRNGAILAVEEINAQGGIKGRRVELIIRDVGKGPEACEQAIHELLAMGVKYIVGPYTSNMAEVSMRAMKGSGAVMVSPSMTTDLLDGKADEVFRLQPSNYMQSKLLAQYASSQGIKTMALVYDPENRAYSLSLIDSFAVEFEKLSGKILIKDSIVKAEPNKRTIKEVSDKLASLKVDGILTVTNGSDLALMTQYLRKGGQTARLMGGSWGMTPDLLAMGGSTVEGMIFSSPAPPAGSAQGNVIFEEKYFKRFGSNASFVSAESWEAVNIILSALKKYHYRESDKVSHYFVKNPMFDGVYDDFRFDDYGDVIRPQTLVQVKDNSFVIVSENQ